MYILSLILTEQRDQWYNQNFFFQSIPFFEVGKSSAQILVPPEYTTIFDALIFASNLQKSVTVEDIST